MKVSVSQAVSLGAILTVAMALLTMGVSLIQQGSYGVGVVCVLVGFGLTVVSVALVELGVISTAEKKLAR
jgi:hypothetical protein